MTTPQVFPVPNLTTSLTGPLLELEHCFLEKQTEIEAWFRAQWQISRAPITSSVDLRNAGFKVAPIDTNLFPAGFNNLNQAFMPLCIQAMEHALNEHCPQGSHVLIIPESHTRNTHYYESLFVLANIVKKSGYHVMLGSLSDTIDKSKTIVLASGETMTIHRIEKVQGRLLVEGNGACFYLLNNDLSDGIPETLTELSSPIESPTALSWFSRKKSTHFMHYQQICESFAKVTDIDPWLINPLFRICTNIDFMAREGEACLIQHTELLMSAIQKKYDEYGIKQKPFVVIKSDAGTYGMGILIINDIDDLKSLNRKQRKKMAAGKGSVKITQVILQEGVPTKETVGPSMAMAEPVVYMLGKHVVGGFYRVHAGRAENENLNAPGSSFEPLAFAAPCNNPRTDADKASVDEPENRFYAYGVIAQLAALAAAHERAQVLS